MTDRATSPASSPSRRLRPGVLLLAAAFSAAALYAAGGHAPDWGRLARQPLEIQLHIAGALFALLIGTVLLVGIKGTAVHRGLGWAWVLAMTVTAISSLFIRQINGGALSLIHLLSGWTLIGLPMGVWAVRRGRIRAHARHMTGLFIGALIVAGAFAFVPGRLMWSLFFG